jgi:glycine/D-amino acid oxidase-like deaminating enzyme
MGRRAASQTIEARRARDRLRHQRSRTLQKAKITLCDSQHAPTSNALRVSPATRDHLSHPRLIQLASFHRLAAARLWLSMKRATSRLLPRRWRHTARPKPRSDNAFDQLAVE